MNLEELNQKLDELQKKENEVYNKISIELSNKVTKYFQNLFSELTYHDSLKISASKNDVRVKILGWGLSDSFREGPISFTLRAWGFKEENGKVPMEELEIIRLSFDKTDLNNKELIEKYFNFLNVVGKYTELILKNKDDMEETIAKYSKEADYTEYYNILDEKRKITDQVVEEKNRIREEKLNKIYSMPEITFKDNDKIRKFYYGGERYDYLCKVVRIVLIKRLKTKTNLEIYYQNTHRTLNESKEIVNNIKIEKFWKEEMYTKYFDEFIAENLDNIKID